MLVLDLYTHMCAHTYAFSLTQRRKGKRLRAGKKGAGGSEQPPTEMFSLPSELGGKENDGDREIGPPLETGPGSAHRDGLLGREPRRRVLETDTRTSYSDGELRDIFSQCFPPE